MLKKIYVMTLINQNLYMKFVYIGLTKKIENAVLMISPIKAVMSLGTFSLVEKSMMVLQS